MAGRVVYRTHALQRMFARGIPLELVRSAVEDGEVIEEYPDDFPYPSKLILGWWKGRAVHVVVAHNVECDEDIVVTIYEPDPNQWDDGFRRRKQ